MIVARSAGHSSGPLGSGNWMLAAMLTLLLLVLLVLMMIVMVMRFMMRMLVGG